MHQVTQDHIDPASSLSKASVTALGSISSSEPRLQVFLHCSGALTSDQLVPITAADRQTAKLLLSTLPQNPQTTGGPRITLPNPKPTPCFHLQSFKYVLWWADRKMLCFHVSCSSPILYTEATASTPNLFSPLLPPRPPHHYLVGFCKEGSLLREYVSLLQSLLITPLFLSNTQQVSVLIVQALGKRKWKEG